MLEVFFRNLDAIFVSLERVYLKQTNELIRCVKVHHNPRDYDLVSIISKAYWQLRIR